MTLITRPGERWEASEGSPQGPSFDVTVPSKTSKGTDYRIVRDAVTGVLIHQPACMSWEKRGPGLCTHVRTALARAGAPDARFAYRVAEAMNVSGYGLMLNGLDERFPSIAALIREIRAAQDEWTAGLERLDEAERMRAERKPSHEDAFAELGVPTFSAREAEFEQAFQRGRERGLR